MMVTMNTTGLSYVGGLISGMGKGVNKANFLSNAVDLAHNTLQTNFEQWMDIVSMTAPSSLMHVYEWGQLGQPNGRLWESQLIGAKTKTKRSVVVWKPSRVPTPVRDELLIPGPSGQTVKEGVHIFVWKAPVMEMGMQITVAPQASGSGSLAYMAGGELRITKKPSTFEAGGGNTAGKFTSNYYTWWNTMAQGVYNQKVLPKFQRNVNAGARKGVQKAGHRTFYRVAGSDSASFRKGTTEGLSEAEEMSRNFEQEAAARRVYLYGA